MPSATQAQVQSRENGLKAVFCLKFFEYVTWPDHAFEDANTPIVIGTIGDGRVAAILKQFGDSDRRLQGRNVEHRVVETLEQARSCHQIFVDDSVDAEHVNGILGEVPATAPIMIIGETPGFAGTIGGIELSIRNNNLRIVISQGDLNNRQLRINSQLQRIVETVP